MSQLTDQIKQRVSIFTLAGSDKPIIRCPLPGHPDKNPSCYLYEDSNSFNCFGCNRGGSVIDFLIHRDGLDKKEAIRMLADMAGLEWDTRHNEQALAEWENEKRLEKALAYAADYYHQTLLEKAVNPMDMLIRRGFSRESIQAFRIGYADGSLIEHLKSATLDGLSLDDFKTAGLLRKESGQDYFQHRITFPSIKSGKVLNISGRAFLDGDSPKYLHLAGQPTDYFYNEDALKQPEEVWLMEGHPDTVTAVQAGLNALGVVGTGGMKHPEKLKRCKTIYICGDSDTPGKDASERWAADILKHNPNAVIRFIQLPNAKDFNEWYLKHRDNAQAVAEFKALIENALDLISFKIARLSDVREIKTLYPLLATLDENYVDVCFGKITAQLPGTKAGTIKSTFKTWKKRHEQENKAQAEIKAVALNHQHEKLQANISFVEAPDQQYIANVCLYADITREEEGEEVTSNEPIILRCLTTHGRAGYQAQVIPVANTNEFKPSSVPERNAVKDRWDDTSFQEFLSGKAPEENTTALFQDIRKLFSDYIWHPDPRSYDIFALWAMGTYLARHFGSFPYLSMQGQAGSGKTTVLDVLSVVAFNASLSVRTSNAALSRDIESAFITWLKDEAETYNTTTPENADEIGMINAGYREGIGTEITAKNPVTGNFEKVRFDTFCCKAFAGIRFLQKTLATRSILVEMKAAPKEIARNFPNIRQQKEAFNQRGAELRARLYRWMLTKWSLAAKSYASYEPVDGIDNRNWELWLPLLTIAELVDLENPSLTPDSLTLTEEMILTAQKITRKAKEQQDDLDLGLKIVLAIIDLLEDIQECRREARAIDEQIREIRDGGWYATDDVTRHVRDYLLDAGKISDAKKINNSLLILKLKEKGILDGTKETQARPWDFITRKKPHCIRLKLEDLKGVAGC